MKKTFADQREYLQQQEQKKPTVHCKNPALSTISWKETLVLIILAIIGYVLYRLFT